MVKISDEQEAKELYESIKALPYVERMIQERNELADKIGKLAVFINENPLFRNLAPAKKELLRQQYQQMWEYNKTLTARIALEDITFP